LYPVTYAPYHIFSEEDNPYISNEDHPYAQAKFFADQAVRKFIQNYPQPAFEITSISPVMVIGNSLSNRQDSTSIGLQYLIKNKIAPNPFLEMLYHDDAAFAMVDVRDVAETVFEAATRHGLHGKNYLVANESYRISDISLMLNKQVPQSAARVVYSNALAKKDLGIHFIPAQETLNNCG
jgi:nucleoside-diphosphate-sugar epimerase